MLKLRPAIRDDAPLLAELGGESFVAAFGHLYSDEDLAAFLRDERSEARFAAQLANPAVRAALVEDEGGRALAYALTVRGKGFAERPEPRPSRPVYLSQLYCAGGQPGRGLGARLMEWVLAEAKGWSADAVQLSVFSGNAGAQRFYRRYGFAHVADIDFWVGGHRDDEFLYEVRVG